MTASHHRARRPSVRLRRLPILAAFGVALAGLASAEPAAAPEAPGAPPAAAPGDGAWVHVEENGAGQRVVKVEGARIPAELFDAEDRERLKGVEAKFEVSVVLAEKRTFWFDREVDRHELEKGTLSYDPVSERYHLRTQGADDDRSFESLDEAVAVIASVEVPVAVGSGDASGKQLKVRVSWDSGDFELPLGLEHLFFFLPTGDDDFIETTEELAVSDGPAEHDPQVVRERRKRRRELALALLLFGIVAGASYVVFRAFRGDLTGVGLLIIGVNGPLLALACFFVLRNLAKMLFERRRGVVGSRLRTKVVFAFVSLTVIPGAVLLMVSVRYTDTGIEAWFKRGGRGLAPGIPGHRPGLLPGADVRDAGRRPPPRGDDPGPEAAERAEPRGPPPRPRQPAAGLSPGDGRGVLGPRRAGGGRPRHRGVRPRSGPIPGGAFLGGALAGKPADVTLSLAEVEEIPPEHRGGEVIKVATPIFSTFQPDRVVGVVVVHRWIPQSLNRRLDVVRQSYQAYTQLKIGKQDLQRGFVLGLLAITGLVIVLSIFFGTYLSREITGPLEQLADATRQVAAGDLEVRIEARSADEVGTLVQSFNRMTTELLTGRLALEERRLYIETILKNVAAGVVSVDRRGRITTLNKSAERLLGLDSTESLGKRYRALLPAEQRDVLRELVRSLGRSRGDTVERQIQLTVDDRVLTLLASVSLLRDEEERFLGLVFVFDDLTQLLKAQRMAAWREVARRIAHEIKNPLTPIQLSAQRIQNRYQDLLGEDGSVLAECTETIVTQVDELKTLVNEFSNFARMPAANPSPTQLNEIVHDTLKLYQNSHEGITFEDELDPEIPVFSLDREQIKRVIINLVDNAIQAIDGTGGEIKISTHYNRLLELARLEVADTGAGVPPEVRARLFEPYFSTKRGGTGLGLAIVSTIVADHSGYIRLRDRRPHGTTFVIELPIRT